MNTECSQSEKKIRVQVTLTETMSGLLRICRTKGLSDRTVVELALLDYFSRNHIGAESGEAYVVNRHAAQA